MFKRRLAVLAAVAVVAVTGLTGSALANGTAGKTPDPGKVTCKTSDGELVEVIKVPARGEVEPGRAGEDAAKLKKLSSLPGPKDKLLRHKKGEKIVIVGPGCDGAEKSVKVTCEKSD